MGQREGRAVWSSPAEASREAAPRQKEAAVFTSLSDLIRGLLGNTGNPSPTSTYSSEKPTGRNRGQGKRNTAKWSPPRLAPGRRARRRPAPADLARGAAPFSPATSRDNRLSRADECNLDTWSKDQVPSSKVSTRTPWIRQYATPIEYLKTKVMTLKLKDPPMRTIGRPHQLDLEARSSIARKKLIAVGLPVGTNQVDLNAARERGIMCSNAPTEHPLPGAELVLGLRRSCFAARHPPGARTPSPIGG